MLQLECFFQYGKKKASHTHTYTKKREKKKKKNDRPILNFFLTLRQTNTLFLCPILQHCIGKICYLQKMGLHILKLIVLQIKCNKGPFIVSMKISLCTTEGTS